MLPVLLNQTSKNKSETEKSNLRFFEEMLLLLWRQLASLSILPWSENTQSISNFFKDILKKVRNLWCVKQRNCSEWLKNDICI